jgi:Glycosyl transferase family 2
MQVAGHVSPFVSIVITSYNYDQYLGGTIDSALAQSYARTEVIVVDDGSTDTSREIINAYGAQCTKVFQDNRGEAAASLSGLRVSRGDIVLFLDSDDLLDRDAVEQIVAAWRPGCVKAQFYLRNVDSDGHPIGQRKPNIDFVPNADISKCLFHYGYYPSPPTSGNAYARPFLLEVLPEAEPSWRNGIDGYLNALAPLHGDVVSISAELGSYRVHDRNMSAWTGLTLKAVREGMLREIARERAIVSHAERHGIRIKHALVTNIPAHCKARILSLRLDRPTHPIPSDTIPLLLALGIAAIWRFPHTSLRKRVGSTFGLLALLVAPRSWLDRRLHAVFVAELRPRLSDLIALRQRGSAAGSSA